MKRRGLDDLDNTKGCVCLELGKKLKGRRKEEGSGFWNEWN